MNLLNKIIFLSLTVSLGLSAVSAQTSSTSSVAVPAGKATVLATVNIYNATSTKEEGGGSFQYFF